MTARTVTLGEDCAVALRRRFATTVDDLWDACTNPERIPRWFLPVSGDLRPDGRFQLEGHAGGDIEACDPPHGFRATWESGGKVSRIEVRLTPDGDGAQLEIIHSAQALDDFWQQFGPGATGLGWDSMLHGLDRHLTTGAAVDREWAAAWMASEEARAFFVSSAEGWRVAHVAAGASEADARAAADAALAAYTTPG